MIDRNDLELRIATHADTVARINEQAWQVQAAARPRRLRRLLARTLVALAARVGPGTPAVGLPAQPASERPVGA